MSDLDSKMRVLQRIVAGKHGVERHEIVINTFSETKEGCLVDFNLDGEINEYLVTWWDIAFSS